MAFKMSVEAADGRMVEDAYWVPVQIYIAGVARNGRLVFHAYNSGAAMDAGKEPIAGAVKEYLLTQQEFVAAQMTPLAALFPAGVSGQNIVYEVFARFSYGIARSRQDVPMLDADGHPVLDEAGHSLMRSFFEAAVDI